MATYGDPVPPAPPAPGTNKRPKKAPQEILSEFWDKFHSKHPGKVTSVFPRSLYASLLPAFQPKGASSTRNAQESYESAARECREKVKRIIQYVREQYKMGPSVSDDDSEAPRSTGALKFDFSQLMDTSA